MSANTRQLQFDGAILKRGFWLYVWEITLPDGAKLYYVGRTGDSSSINAQSPFTRMGQHLGFAKNSNMLRRHLSKSEATPETCHFHLVAHGPILEESKSKTIHRERRDIIAAMEKALAEAMKTAGYRVMNSVKSRMLLDLQRLDTVLAAFAIPFPALATLIKAAMAKP